MRASHLAAISMLVLTPLSLPAVLEAQGAGDGARQSTEQQAIRCVFTDAECIAKAAGEGKPVDYTDAEGNRTDAEGLALPATDLAPGVYPGSYVSLHGEVGVLQGAGGPQALVSTHRHAEALTAVRIMVDGSYIKMYLDEERVANIPNATLNRSDRPTFIFGGHAAHPAFLGEIRIAAGGAPIYDALLEDGRVRLHGILFETRSARIRPESTPTLLEIGEMLERNAELRLSIEGHTDSVGGAEANQALSEDRAAAVRSYLVGSHGIDAGRLEAVGFGETQPVDSNDTPEGRQNNRRVELVRR